MDNELTSLNKSINGGVKTSLAQKVSNRITEALINKELRPGDRLPPVEELTRSLGVGKSSVREAIKMFEALGVVESKQGEGTFICKHPVENSINPLIIQLILEQGGEKDIISLRSMFEPAYTLMAMQVATDEDKRKIEETIFKLEEKIKTNSQTADDDMNFHLMILKSTHNPYVIRIGETIMQLFRASLKKSMVRIPNVALNDHKSLFTAFCNNDSEGIMKAIMISFESWSVSLHET